MSLGQSQESKVTNNMINLRTGRLTPDSLPNDEEIANALEVLEEAAGFTADIFFEDDDQVVCIELKTVKPNKGIFKVEKQKILEAEAALRRSYPRKKVKFYIGFPFDPLSKEPTGYDKQRFMKYSVDFDRYFSEKDFLLAAELWDYLSDTEQTMEMILEIINSIATVDFMENFDFLQKGENAATNKSEYLNLLNRWFLFREIRLIENREGIHSRLKGDSRKLRVFNQGMFVVKREGEKFKVEYNEDRNTTLSTFIM